MEATVTEIHAYPSRPEGYEEPLFGGSAHDRRIMEHYLRAPWLGFASEYAAGSPAGSNVGSGRSLAEPREVRLTKEKGEVLVRPGPVGDGGGLVVRRRLRRCSVRGGAILRVLDRWREVYRWWEDGGGRDLVVYRVELSCGAVVDLARDRSVDRSVDGAGRWLLVGMVD